MGRRRWMTLLCVVVMWLSPIGAGAQNHVKFGVVAPETGSFGLFGNAFRRGIELRMQELNASGGILGQRIELVREDSEGNVAKGLERARKLAQEDKVQAVFVFAQNAPGAAAIAKGATDSEVVAIATSPGITPHQPLGSFGFAIGPTAETWGQVAAQIVAGWQITRVATWAAPDDLGKGVIAAFEARLKSLAPSLRIVDRQWPEPGLSDYGPLIEIQRRQKPEGVFVFSPFGFEASRMLPTAQQQAYFSRQLDRIIVGSVGGTPRSWMPDISVADLIRCPECQCISYK